MLYNENLSGLLIGCLLKQPQLLLQPQYPLCKDDFEPCLLHQILYLCLQRLVKSGVQEATEIEIENVVKNHPVQMEVLQDNNYFDFIATMKEFAVLDNYEYYYTTTRKFSLLRDMKASNFDITPFYDEMGNEEDELAKLERTSIQEILGAIELDTIQLRAKYDTAYVRDEMKAGEDTDELLEVFKEKPAFGAYLQSPYLSTLWQGWCRGHLLLRSAASGLGKAIPDDTMIPTTDGWRYVRSIMVGDYLYDRLGKPTKVLGVFHQGLKMVWEISLSDGRKAKCCDEHLWQVNIKGEDYVLPLKTMVKLREKGYDMFIPNSPMFLKYKEYYKPNEIGEYSLVTNIECLDYHQYMTCFIVDNPEHLFLMNDYIVTHNSRMAVGDLIQTSAIEIWDDDAKEFLLNNNYQGPGFFIHTEMNQRREIAPMFLAAISGVEYKHITQGKCTHEEELRVKKAGEILLQSNITLCDMPDFTNRSIERKIKELAEREGCTYGVFDYVQLQGALAEEYKATTNMPVREDLVLKNAVLELKNMAERYNIGIMSMTQLNDNWKTSPFPDESCLSGSKAMKVKLDGGSIVVATKERQKELRKVESFIVKRSLTDKSIRPNVIEYIYKSRFGEFGDQKIKIWSYFDRGTFRRKDFFCTDVNDNFVSVPKSIPGA